MIEPLRNIGNTKGDTKELLIEMYYSITNNDYPCYNSAMLLFRPILVHILTDMISTDVSDHNYSSIINEIYSNSNITKELKNELHKMKNFINEINHNYKVVLDKDKNLVEDCWNIIRKLVEAIY